MRGRRAELKGEGEGRAAEREGGALRRLELRDTVLERAALVVVLHALRVVEQQKVLGRDSTRGGVADWQGYENDDR